MPNTVELNQCSREWLAWLPKGTHIYGVLSGDSLNDDDNCAFSLFVVGGDGKLKTVHVPECVFYTEDLLSADYQADISNPAHAAELSQEFDVVTSADAIVVTANFIGHLLHGDKDWFMLHVLS